MRAPNVQKVILLSLIYCLSSQPCYASSQRANHQRIPPIPKTSIFLCYDWILNAYGFTFSPTFQRVSNDAGKICKALISNAQTLAILTKKAIYGDEIHQELKREKKYLKSRLKATRTQHPFHMKGSEELEALSHSWTAEIKAEEDFWNSEYKRHRKSQIKQNALDEKIKNLLSDDQYF